MIGRLDGEGQWVDDEHMKSHIVTNVLLGGLIVLLIVCTAVIQQEIKENRAVMKQWLDKQPDATLVQNVEKTPPPPPEVKTPEAMSDERRATRRAGHGGR